MMKKRLERYILEGPWEGQLQDGMRKLEKWVIWPGMAFAALYFGLGFLRAFAN